jgi:capsular polysaccharide biosynthesis protein
MAAQTAERFELRLGEALDYFGMASKAVFRSDVPAVLGPDVDACCQIISPAARRDVPKMLVVNPRGNPPGIEALEIEPHLLYPHYVIGLRGGVLLNVVGHVADRTGHVFVESMRDRSFLPDRLYARHDLRDDAYRAGLEATVAAGIRHLPGRHLSLVYAMASENWYHWVVENLGRLFAASRLDGFDGMTVILPPGLDAAREETLLRLGIGRERWLIHDGAPLACDELYLPSFGAVRGSVRPEPVQWLRHTLGGALGLSARAGGRLLYISRRDARRRRLANEDEVFARLAPLGFERVSLDGLSFEDQARLFHEARLVVAPHGAGLANLVFSRPGTLLVELLADRRDGTVLRVYHTLALLLGVRYVGVKCIETGTADADFTLDAEVLPALLLSLL